MRPHDNVWDKLPPSIRAPPDMTYLQPPRPFHINSRVMNRGDMMANVRRPPGMPPPNKQHRINPDPNLTLVVYNMSRNVNINNIIEQLSLLCEIYTTEIQNADRLPSTGNRDAPIAITCINPYIKWMFIKEVNKLKFNSETADEFENVFARPFLDEDNLREDRALVRRLISIRTKHQNRSITIYKGDVYETRDGQRSLFTKLTPRPMQTIDQKSTILKNLVTIHYTQQVE